MAKRMNPDEPYGPGAIEDYRQQARHFQRKSREYLAEGELHQASEKGWGTAAWTAKAVALAYGWEYEKHEQFNVVLNNVRALTGNNRIGELRSTANDLHRNFYTRRRFLDAAAIGLDLDQMDELLELLEPLLENGPAAE